MTSSSAAVVRRTVYTAFGERVLEDSGGGQGAMASSRYGYAGAWGYEQGLGAAEDDPADLGFIHIGGRWYDPGSGRFLQRDPIGIWGGKNVFEYCHSDPTARIDPTGLSFWSDVGFQGGIGIGIGAGLGGTIGAVAGGIVGAGIGTGFVPGVGTATGVLGGIGIGSKVGSETGAALGATVGFLSACVAPAVPFFVDPLFQGPDFLPPLDLPFNRIGPAPTWPPPPPLPGDGFWDRGYPGGCFPKGTVVATPTGPVPIETLAPEALVLSGGPRASASSFDSVRANHVTISNSLVRIALPDEVLIATQEHPFWVLGVGWKKAGCLETNDLLQDASGDPVIILSIEFEKVSPPIDVYNLSIGCHHTFYVGKSAVLVHNKP